MFEDHTDSIKYNMGQEGAKKSHFSLVGFNVVAGLMREMIYLSILNVSADT